LIQPLEGESMWSDFLKEHGEGIHHIRFNVPDVEPVIEYLAGHDIGVAQSGSGLRPGTTWVNLDTESKVGFTIEIMNALAGTDGRTPQIADGKVQGNPAQSDRSACRYGWTGQTVSDSGNHLVRSRLWKRILKRSHCQRRPAGR